VLACKMEIERVNTTKAQFERRERYRKKKRQGGRQQDMRQRLRERDRERRRVNTTKAV